MAKKEKILLSERLSFNRFEIDSNHSNLGKAGMWYYTNQETLLKILENKEIWIGNISRMNDLAEVTLHEERKENIYALCFCNTRAERIPMWYLYSGILGLGYSIMFNAETFASFVRSIKSVIPVKDGNKLVEKELTVGNETSNEDVMLSCGWVYYMRDNNEVRFKSIKYDIEEGNFTDKNYFCKNDVWEYEREFRLILENNTNEKFDYFCVKLSDEILDNLKITVAPESYIEWNEERIIAEKERITELFNGTIEDSKINIHMNLYLRNKAEMDRMVTILTNQALGSK